MRSCFQFEQWRCAFSRHVIQRLRNENWAISVFHYAAWTAPVTALIKTIRSFTSVSVHYNRIMIIECEFNLQLLEFSNNAFARLSLIGKPHLTLHNERCRRRIHDFAYFIRSFSKVSLSGKSSSSKLRMRPPFFSDADAWRMAGCQCAIGGMARGGATAVVVLLRESMRRSTCNKSEWFFLQLRARSRHPLGTTKLVHTFEYFDTIMIKRRFSPELLTSNE